VESNVRRARVPVFKDVTKLLANLPRGSWVALSHDEERVVAYDAQIEEAIRKAKEAGEENPIITRVPEKDAVLLL
jgi:uncharacterized protein DUF5678